MPQIPLPQEKKRTPLVKHEPILILFDIQHPQKLCHHKVGHLTRTLWQNYLKECVKIVLQQHSTEFLNKQLVLQKHFNNIVLKQWLHTYHASLTLASVSGVYCALQQACQELLLKSSECGPS